MMHRDYTGASRDTHDIGFSGMAKDRLVIYNIS
jgi:hypothetical protein